MRRCYGLTRNLHRCGREGDWRWFCPEHRRQPITWSVFILFTVVAGAASIYSAWFSDGDAVLRKEVGHMQDAAEIEKQTFRSLSAELTITFTGEWDEPPYPDTILSPINHQYYFEILAIGAESKESIRFYATEPYTFETRGERKAIFRSKQAVRDGSVVIGKSYSVLQQYNSIQFHLPFIMPEKFKTNRIKVGHVKLTFFVNGEHRSAFEFEARHLTPIQFPTDNGFLAWASFVAKLNEPADNIIAPRNK